tara:strand:- start:913 stop:1635 length:723 start_codon:yes stop_codon:yes gene_type:complete
MLTKKIYGLIGRNINYSFSKKYFTQKFKNDKIYNCEYLNFDIGQISDFKKIKLSNINGFNVTIPYKERIIIYLDEVDESARTIGAVNTIKILNNKLIGYNTDYLGFINSFNEKLDYKNALILGSGGASKAIQYAIKNKKINFDVASRKSDINYIDYTEIENLEKYDLIVNCTPLGTHPNINDKPDLNYDQLNDRHLCYDLIYNPSETLFLNESKKRGAKIMNGLQMLKLQAEESWRIWNS